MILGGDSARTEYVSNSECQGLTKLAQELLKIYLANPLWDFRKYSVASMHADEIHDITACMGRVR